MIVLTSAGRSWCTQWPEPSKQTVRDAGWVNTVSVTATRAGFDAERQCRPGDAAEVRGRVGHEGEGFGSANEAGQGLAQDMVGHAGGAPVVPCRQSGRRRGGMGPAVEEASGDLTGVTLLVSRDGGRQRGAEFVR